MNQEVQDQEQDQLGMTYHSRVIFKNPNDEEAMDMVNSYKYNRPENKVKSWSPNISKEERFRKKREREDRYLENFHQGDHPVLIIQNKHAYKGANPDNVLKEPEKTEEYYKVSENTNVIDNITEEIKFLQKQIRRQTQVHNQKKNRLNDPEDVTAIYKIDGIEFLPEGFLELDPLLLKDEYEFESKMDEELFREEQRRLKVLRRKQYEQRHKQKMRDVSIYVLDENKNKIIEFMERWYFKNKRKMNDQEIGYLSHLFHMEPEDIKVFQEAFLKKKQYVNLYQLRNFLDRKRKSDMPLEMTNHIQSNVKYENVQARYNQPQQEYKPELITKYRKKLKRPANVDKSLLPSKTPQKQRTNLDRTLEKNVQDTKVLEKVDRFVRTTPGNQQNQLSAKDKQEIQNLHGQTEHFQNLVEQQQHDQGYDSDNEEDAFYKNPNYDTNVKMYFDSEINGILDKVKGYQPIIQYQEKNIRRPSQQERMLQNRKQSQKSGQMSQGQNGNTNYEDYQNEMLNAYHDDPANYKAWAYTNLGDIEEMANILQDIRTEIQPKRVSVAGKNTKGEAMVVMKLKPAKIGECYYYQTIEDITKDGVRTVKLITKNDSGHIMDQYEIPEEMRGKYYDNEVVDCDPQYEGDESKELIVTNDRGEVVQRKRITPERSYLVTDQFNKQFNLGDFRRPTVLEKPEEKVIKLNPVKHKEKFYVGEITEKKDPSIQTEELHAKIIELPTGEVLIDQKLSPELKSDSYHAEIVQKESPKTQKLNLYVQILNNEGEVLVKKIISSKKKSVNEKKKKSIAPVETQVVEFDEVYEISDNKGNAIGSSELRHFQIRPTLIGNEYYQQVINELVTQGGQKKSVLTTFNEDGKIVEQKEFNSDLITEKYYNRIVKEAFDEQGRKTVVLETLNDKGELIDKREFRPSLANHLLNEYYDGVLEELVTDQNQRRISVLNPKNKKFDVINEQPEEEEREDQERKFSNIANSLEHSREISEHKEEDNEDDKEEKDMDQYFKNLIDKYADDYNRDRKSFNKPKQQKTRNKSDTIGVFRNYQQKKVPKVRNSIREEVKFEKPRNYTQKKPSIYKPNYVKKDSEISVNELEQNISNDGSRTRKSTMKPNKVTNKRNTIPSSGYGYDKQRSLQKDEQPIDKRQSTRENKKKQVGDNEQIRKKNNSIYDQVINKKQVDNDDQIRKKNNSIYDQVINKKQQMEEDELKRKQQMEEEEQQKKQDAIREMYKKLPRNSQKQFEQYEVEYIISNAVDPEEFKKERRVQREKFLKKYPGQVEAFKEMRRRTIEDINKKNEILKEEAKRISRMAPEDDENFESFKSKQQKEKSESFKSLEEKHYISNDQREDQKALDKQMEDFVKQQVERENAKRLMENTDVDKVKRKLKDPANRDLLDEFFDFCEGFEQDEDYKESVLFTSLFYFCLRNKGLDN